MSNLEDDGASVNNVAPILAPDTDAMQEHLQLLFGRATEGRIEITALGPPRGEAQKADVKTRFFTVDDTESAIECAALWNRIPGFNVYVGAALRKDDVFPGQAADDRDFLKTYALWADADNEEQLEQARTTYRLLGVPPPFVVVTGRIPYKRAQLWWPLESPLDDIDTHRAILRGMAAILGTDPKVCTGKQIMRLAGSLAWPKKDGRVFERTEVVAVNGAQREFQIEQLQRAFPPKERSEPGDIADVTVAPSGSLGLTEKVMDGREGYGFRLVRAMLRELVGTTGCDPTADELYRAAAPIYLAKADQVRPGRGPSWFKQKCVEAIQSYHEGVIPGMASLDEAVISWAEKHSKDAPPATENASDEEPEPGDEGPFRASEFHGEPPERQWVVPDWIVQGSVNSLYGDGGLGKTLLAQQLACSVSMGALWLGMPTIQGSVLAVLCEDDKGELHRRHNDIRAAMGYAVGNPFKDVWLWPRVGSDNILFNWDTEARAGKFAERLEKAIQEIRPSLLILDTLADFYGANEIDRVQVNYFVKTMLGGLIKRADWPMTVLLLGHPSVRGKDTNDGFSGSTAWNNAVRSRIYLTKPKDSEADDRLLTRGKSNYAASGEETGIKLVYEGGVLREVANAEDGDTMLWACVQEVVKEVDQAWKTRPFMAAKTHPRYIYKALIQTLCARGYGRDLVKQSIQTAIDDDQIFNSNANGKRGFRVASPHFVKD